MSPPGAQRPTSTSIHGRWRPSAYPDNLSLTVVVSVTIPVDQHHYSRDQSKSSSVIIIMSKLSSRKQNGNYSLLSSSARNITKTVVDNPSLPRVLTKRHSHQSFDIQTCIIIEIILIKSTVKFTKDFSLFDFTDPEESYLVCL